MGWLLSAPMKGCPEGSKVKVNFVSHESLRDSALEKNIHRLWDYETLEIREEARIHEGLRDLISFNGTRYKVCLPWKEGHKPLPNSYRCIVRRLKVQLEEVRKEPNVLFEYISIIKQQEDHGIIERVAELESSEKVHYQPHHADHSKGMPKRQRLGWCMIHLVRMVREVSH